MKKIISFILCFCIIFSTAMIPVSASSETVSETFTLSGLFERILSFFVSILTRFFNKLTGQNDFDTPPATIKPPSWQEYYDDDFVNAPEQVLYAQTWVAVELTFISDKYYPNPLYDAQLDLLLYGNGKLYTIPGYWSSGYQWNFRFVCPEEGDWYYRTVCSDAENTSLNDRTGKIVCSEYNGSLDIYKHGFISADTGKKYLTYADGTPFFWLGDTHWFLGSETVDVVTAVCEKRVSQGFTVFQSEPLGAVYDLTNGVSQDDMYGFFLLDQLAYTIAQYGLVNANAQFFFPTEMDKLIENHGGYSETILADGMRDLSDEAKEYLEKLSRYWVARYGAYPTVWTLGQEVDRDVYWDSSAPHSQWNYINNPYKLVAEYIDKYDPYNHPITAHQENAMYTNAYGNGVGASDTCTVYNQYAEPSAFRDVEAHNLYAAQWHPAKVVQSDFKIEKDYWYNSQGKPVINYEGQYCYLWTKNFGARLQGWAAFLNGMYGYGWGAHDTWCFGTTFDEDTDTFDGVDTVTSEEKTNTTWQDALEYDSSYQVGYMRDFFENTRWYNLVPRFDDNSYFAPVSDDVYYICASSPENTEMVIYFYSFSDPSVGEVVNSPLGGEKTGTVGNLVPLQKYTYQWFDPISGTYSEKQSFTASLFGTYYVGDKPASTDMVLYIRKSDEKPPLWQENIEDTVILNPEQELTAQTWVMTEIYYVSDKYYINPLDDVKVDLILFKDGKRYTIPGFWNGGYYWNFRFVCPEEGTWYFKTVCSDKGNATLDGRTGKIECTKYSGNHEIYKHGFLSADSGNKYITYSDGTPFFWLGDTHWALGSETVDVVRAVCEKRVAQGFTVFQSEPLGAHFDLTNGVSQDDMYGFMLYDQLLYTIAQYGLVNSSALFFFPSEMQTFIMNHGGYSDTVLSDGMYDLSDEAKDQLRKLTRYWVARYGAYPTAWTLGQEIDRDLYWEASAPHSDWNYINNPYKLVAEYVDRYDPYNQPISAHQEHAMYTSAYGNGIGASDDCTVYNPSADPSAFRDVEAHNFYAAQWHPDKTIQSNFSVEKDYWYNSQGKPVINYEGQYCYLWTKDFGARLQGWAAFLNGMYGYGWGGQDTWCFGSTFDEETDTFDGVDIVTSQEKTSATWQDSLEYASSYQVGYMKQFLEKTSWYNLIPRFDDKSYFTPQDNVYYICASTPENTEMVIYFYSFSDPSVGQVINSPLGGYSTGTVGNLSPFTKYTYQWFDPVSGTYYEEKTFTASSTGTFFVGEKPTAKDMVLLVKKSNDPSSGPEQVISAKTWVMTEVTYISDKYYLDTLDDVTVDLILYGNDTTYTIPGFWNGGYQWNFRFVCPEAGDWYFETVCSDETNASLNGRTGKVECTEYDGNLEIYKHGFISADTGKKYLTYADGTPFFWLGDTHWSLGTENADMVRTICEKRVSQGFTVFQSEPLGTAFNLTNGISQDDIYGFFMYDQMINVIAEYGLVNSNAQFFFPKDMQTLIMNNGGYSGKLVADGMHDLSDEAKDHLEKLSRYWVARYGAYPVVWTLGQEVDRDLYWTFDPHSDWNYITNPYKLVAEYIDKYDPYNQPITAHQENAMYTTAYGNGQGASDNCTVYSPNTKPSAFRDVEAHDFYAAQWHPAKGGQSDFSIEKDYWYNSQGKPVINYEGQYCYLWTKNFGARMQGWTAYLNGMFGYGWGGQDTWCYTSPYDEDTDTFDGVDTITSQEKKNATWQDSLEFASSYQVGYMKNFFEQTEWYNLIPRFDDRSYFYPHDNVYYACASNADNTEIVIYFYSFSDPSVGQVPNSKKAGDKAGIVGNLIPNETYTYQWFDPINGNFYEEKTFTASSSGTYYFESKPTYTDMTILIRKA